MKNKQNFILSNTVAFIGLMGAGKTTLGRQFAKMIHADFVDSDEEIVQRAGISIPEIFELILGKYSLMKFLLKPIASKLQPPL